MPLGWTSAENSAFAHTNYGCVGWRRDLAAKPIEITPQALRINDAVGNLNESASWSNVAHVLALARILTGVPNLAERLADLANIGDPDQALTQIKPSRLISTRTGPLFCSV